LANNFATAEAACLVGASLSASIFLFTRATVQTSPNLQNHNFAHTARALLSRQVQTWPNFAEFCHDFTTIVRALFHLFIPEKLELWKLFLFADLHGRFSLADIKFTEFFF
jgi:hypothetical protein